MPLHWFSTTDPESPGAASRENGAFVYRACCARGGEAFQLFPADMRAIAPLSRCDHAGSNQVGDLLRVITELPKEALRILSEFRRRTARPRDCSVRLEAERRYVCRAPGILNLDGVEQLARLDLPLGQNFG